MEFEPHPSALSGCHVPQRGRLNPLSAEEALGAVGEIATPACALVRNDNENCQLSTIH
ncbi:MAG: hypothetical protein IJD63_02265 [Oscillospiraceae bacterium]|nr:hypothetical protein [Oscillospiraceae bacterium]